MISNGTKIGRYEIRSLIGAGGMGEVYLARDSKIGRDVAIKVLPAALSTDKDRLARFEQEAQAAGALNHPNILSVYDVDTHDDAPYVVSELLEGETLRQRIDAGDVTQRKALDYGVQIANGLAAAHAKGIVHRDIKPENIFVTTDERVKILDFGLAKLIQREGDNVSSDAPTRKVSTDPGMVMGTAGYMSPEQVRGSKVDHRTDLFSFGTVLYEMLTGKPPFRGDSGVETLNAILKEDPPEFTDVTTRTVHPALESVVRHCLEKKPDQRFQSATDIAFALEAFSRSSGSAPTVITAGIGKRTNRERIFWIAACFLLLLAAGAFAYAFFSRQPAAAPQLRLALKAPPGTSNASAVTISPNGQRVVFAATDAQGKWLLWIRPLNSLEARPLDGTDDAASPFWAPDSRHVGYFAGGKLYRIDTEGGRPQVLCDVNGDRGHGGTWNRDGVVLFGAAEGIYRVSATGGKPNLVTRVGEKEEAHRWPYFLPDGRHFVFLGDASRAEDHNIRLGSLESEETQVLFSAISRVVYASPGYLLFFRQGTLLAQPFDAASGKISGDPAVVADQIADIGANHEFDYSVSENGLLVYQVGTRSSYLVWYDRSGKELERFNEPADYTQVSVFPDGRRAVTTIVDPDRRNGDLWIVDFARHTRSRITFDPQGENMPAVSPDGSRVAYSSSRKEGGWRSLFQLTLDSGQDDELYYENLSESLYASWSPDGRSILFTQCPGNEPCNLRILSLDGGREWRQYLQPASFFQFNGQVSPDGKYAAYVSDESGRPEVYVQTFPQPGQKRQISINGGDVPRWRTDGRELYYMSPDGRLMAVTIRVGNGLESDAPVELFHTSIKRMDGYGYAAASDGQKFLINTRTEMPGGPSLIVVQNWAAALQH